VAQLDDTSREVVGLTPDGDFESFHCLHPSGPTMTLESTQPLTEMSTRDLPWGSKGGRCVGLITIPPPCADCKKFWKPETSGAVSAYPRVCRESFSFPSLPHV
jgi:hypothetical protein